MTSEEKLSAVVSVRFTEQEVAELRAAAGSRPVSHVIRELALDGLRGPGTATMLPQYNQATSTPGSTATVLTTNPNVSAPSQGHLIGVFA